MTKRNLKPDLSSMIDRVNPFSTNDFTIWVSKLYKRGATIKTEDGTIEPYNFELETQQFLRKYVGTESRLLDCKLSDRALRMWNWIGHELEYGQDYIWINRLRYMDENSISSINTYKDSVNDLLDKGYIGVVRSELKDVYWINPRLIFKGSRVNKYPYNVRKK